VPEFSQIVMFTVATLLLALTPGPDIIYVIIRGAAQGPKAGLAAALGLVVGVLGHTAFCIIGLTTLLATSMVAFTSFKLMGAAYLIYLGARMWMISCALDLSANENIKPLISIFRQTILMNLINPKVALFFLAFLPQFVDPEIGPVHIQFILFGGIFMVSTFIVMGCAGLAGGQIFWFLGNNKAGAHFAHRIVGIILIGLGFWLGFQGRY
jgi:threonine/homoserine/homoserine lactone efflux protein